MSRFLLATWDGGGTIPPELGLAAELVGRGHEVVVLSDDTVEQEAAEAGATFTPWQRAPQARARDAERALIRDWEVRNPLAQVRQVGELLFFGPASLHAADLSDAIDRALARRADRRRAPHRRLRRGRALRPPDRGGRTEREHAPHAGGAADGLGPAAARRPCRSDCATPRSTGSTTC